ncbi:EH domain-containing and endocytosis protein 1 [Candida viswanathii]|uniref:EH domain-containing and endocytosis protein 1 n=1 Tax=Candida viswanathii TaxID=5486 RepID=A0A367YES5_9ASCO|nr:EH domain-containing and endocytosis protein 1 [Candida viswanathii]
MSVSQSTPTFKVGLTPEEKSLYTHLFKSLDPENSGVVTGEKARTTFEKSGLPPSILGEIWQIADLNNLGFLNQFGFCYAMRLIGYTQAGQHPVPGLADVPGPLPKFVNLSLPQTALQPQSTSSSFMSSQPNASIPQTAVSQDSISPVSPVDYQKFSQLFIKTVGTPQGELGGAQAKDIFLKAKLPTPVLGQIWALVDRNNKGTLNVGAFVIAMHLIQGLLSGQIKQLPPFLPESIWQSVEQPQRTSSYDQLQSRQVSHSSINSQLTAIRHPPASREAATSEWIVTPAMKQQYESVFSNLDKEKKGQLSPDQVASFLMTSKLSQQDLALVWDLADIQNSGIFTQLEFSIALFLVNRKIAGKSLPNVVPDELLSSLKQPSTPAANSQFTQATSPAPQPPQLRNVSEAQNQGFAPPPVQQQSKPKSSMDDLADIFGAAATTTTTAATTAGAAASASPAPTPAGHLIQARVSSSDLSHNELPKVRTTLTGSFKPTSTFGQSLMQKQQPLSNLSSNLASPVEETPSVQTKEAVAPQASPAAPEQPQQKTVNYDALRSVPPPPPQQRTASPATGVARTPSQQFSSTGRPASQQSGSVGANNDDLLADPAISGQLSQATSDIANVSNQIKSLTTQTTNLHEKKTRAEQELQRILKTKSDIEIKLKQLRTSYDNEVKQVEQVESNLATAKEETEALRSETSIAEAKVNSLTSELQEKQVSMEGLQKENSILKEKLGTLNAEIAELEKQVTARASDTQTLSNQVSVKKSQVQVAIVKSEELKGKLKEIEAHHKQLQVDLDNAERNRLSAEQEARDLQNKSADLEKNKPTKPSSGIAAAVGAAAGAAVAGAAGIVHHVASSSSSGAANAAGATGSIPEAVQRDQAAPSNVDDVNKRFPELDVNEPADNVTNTTSSNITDRAVDDGETPITSPSNSDFQFPQGNNAGIVGGMVGMPGVLVGVQRTESLTSSVQNNAALSVRDDNIDEISDRETLEHVESGEETAPNTANSASFESRDRQEGSDKGSSSFEMVNSEEARSPDNNEEFPPIRELDYQESDSSDEDNEEEQTFDDALDQEQPAPPKQAPAAQGTTVSAGSGTDSAFDDFDFDNLQPAAREANDKGFFDDEFDHLPAANVANNGDEEFENEKDAFGGLSGDFTSSNAPDFNQPQETSTGPISNNDEWEELFAGFGNAQAPQPEVLESQTNATIPGAYASEPPAPAANEQPVWHPGAPTTPGTTTATTAPSAANKIDSYAVQELVGMGFDEDTAIDALNKQNGNLEAATNYLLDNA